MGGRERGRQSAGNKKQEKKPKQSRQTGGRYTAAG
jgi:hypothetical protein